MSKTSLGTKLISELSMWPVFGVTESAHICLETCLQKSSTTGVENFKVILLETLNLISLNSYYNIFLKISSSIQGICLTYMYYVCVYSDVNIISNVLKAQCQGLHPILLRKNSIIAKIKKIP